MIQEGTQSVEQLAAEAMSETPAMEKGISLWELFLNGGMLMWVLLALSVVAVWIFAERWWAIRKATKIDKVLWSKSGSMSTADR